MTAFKEDVVCPHCKKKNRMKFHDELSTDAIPSILDKSIFQHTCKYCNKKIAIEHPLTLKGDNYIIYYTPTKDEVIKDESNISIKRVCDTYNDFKEKILVLESDLNDFVIEFIKCYIHDKLIEQDEITNDIRFTCSKENTLEFYLLDLEKGISINRELYDNLINKIKIKKCEDAIMVDTTTFRKYVKI